MAPKKLHQPVTKTCPVCSKKFECQQPYQVLNQVCCSRKCANQHSGKLRTVKRIKRKCRVCGTAMEVLPCHKGTKWYCSNKCRGEGRDVSGEANPAWNGGNGYYWKHKAKKRDEGLCRECGKKFHGKKLHGHHVIPLAMGGQDSLENIVSLCHTDHQTVEKQFYDALDRMLGDRYRRAIIAAQKEVLDTLS